MDPEPPDLQSLELTRLGTRTVVYAPRSGTILLADDLAVEIQRRRAAGEAVAEISTRPSERFAGTLAGWRQLVRETIACWNDSGIFSSARAELAGLPPYVPVEGPAQTYSMGDRLVSIRCADPVLRAFLGQGLAPLRTDASDRMPDAQIEITGRDPGYAVFRDGEAVWRECGLDLARHLVLVEALEAFFGEDRIAAVLHAGAVSLGHEALVLAGDTGCGKTTLTLGLVNAGCAFLADDLTPLLADGPRVGAYPVRMNLKPGSWDLDEVRAQGLDASAPRPIDDIDVRLLSPHPQADPGETHTAKALIFPDFGSEGEEGLGPVTPEEALTRLIATGSRLASRCRTIGPLAKLLNSVPAYVLRYRDSRLSVPACLGLLRDDEQ